QPIAKMQKPLPPQDSIRRMVTPGDFEIKIFADESLLGGKPICINWDERGRLWAALTADYPNELQKPGKGRDRIVIVEDTDHDGKGDKVTTFADKLSIPTSLAFARGGVVVTQAPDTLFLKDTDGDDKADVRQVLFSGWNTSDTHAGPSNLNYGLDNWMYGMVGYSGFEGDVNGERNSFRTGFFRFQPDGSKMEFLRNTNNNSWGVGFSEEGILFGSTANGNPCVYLPIPNRYYEAVRGWSSSVLGGIAGNAPIHPITENVRHVDHHGHFTSAAGHALYTARNYPSYYWNRTSFVTEPTGHVVATFTLQREGSDFRARDGWNLMASDDGWFAPIMAEVGPDGNVWVLDWYNYIVQHNPTPAGYKTGKGNAYESDLRDKKHGRIYRLVPRGGKSAPHLDLKNASPAQLVAALANDNFFWRRHAQRLLVERGEKTVANDLIALVENQGMDGIGLNPGAIHALWTLHGLGLLTSENEAALKAGQKALGHPSAGVRRNAVQVLPSSDQSTQTILNSSVLKDPDFQVRLMAFLALAGQPSSDQAGKALAEVLHRSEDLDDRWIPDAVTSAAAAHARPFLEAALTGKTPNHPRARDILSIVATHFAGSPRKDAPEKILTVLEKGDPVVSEIIIAGLVKGWKRGRPETLAPEMEASLKNLFKKQSATGRANLLRLASILGSTGMEQYAVEVSKNLLESAAKADLPEQERISAAKQVIELQPTSESALASLLELISPRTSPLLVAGILEAAASSQATGNGQAILNRMNEMTPTAKSSAIRALLGRPNLTVVLLDAAEKGKFSLGDLALDQKQALASHPDGRIRERAKKLLASGGDIPNPDRQKVVEQYLPMLKKKADSVKGKVVFKNQCAKCHMHSGEGTAIGPDLTGMASHPKEELLIHIMDPSRSVEGNFRIFTISTLDGKILSGMLASETRTSVEVIDAEAKRIIVQRDTIEQLTGSNKSLMPEGFEKQLKEDEVLDLLEFLTQKGKYVPLALEKAATIVSTQGMFFSKDGEAERLIFSDWKPKTFNGIPFYLVDPRGDKGNNVILLNGPLGTIAPTMPKNVSLPCNTPARAIHLLSGVSGWGFPVGEKGSVSMIVRLHYADGSQEDHRLVNGVHFADYIRRVDVPGSKFAFPLRGQQIRYLAVYPERQDNIARIEFIKGPDQSAPVVMAVTVETR
ncbi:MAG: PVC-type heme-binding CxxCH protein, partial [Gemmataceae bacterium]